MTKSDATQGLVNAISANIFMLEARIEATTAVTHNMADPRDLAIQRAIDLGTVDRLKLQLKGIIELQKKR